MLDKIRKLSPQVMSLLMFLMLSPTISFAKTGTNTPEDALTLYDAIMLAMRGNRAVENAYLDRILQKFNLEVAETEFFPKLDFDGTISTEKSRSKRFLPGAAPVSTRSNRSAIGLTMREKIPTGANITMSWQRPVSASQVGTDTDSTSRSDTLTIALSQPLLKGAGLEVNTASLQQARISEESNLLSLKSTLISTVGAVITSYRGLLQADKQLEISHASLERAKTLLEKNKLLIQVGKMAPMEKIQAEAEVARSEFSYQQAINSRDNARLGLIDILDIDRNTSITLDPQVVTASVSLDQEKLLAIAYSQRIDYQQSLLAGRGYQIGKILADNNQLWDLSLTAGASFSNNVNNGDRSEESGWNAGLSLKIPLYGDSSRKQALMQAKINLQKHAINQLELRESIAITVQNGIRDVKMQQIQLKLAQQNLKLSEKKLAVEQEKLQYGMTTNFQLVQFQNDLVAAQTSELTTKIAYLNALTQLDQALGTTLETWGIRLNRSQVAQDRQHPELRFASIGH